MNCDRSIGRSQDDQAPVEQPLPGNDDAAEENEGPMLEELNFCELCGASENDDEEGELLRCEECGRLHCANCRKYDEEGTPYCTDCYDDLTDQ